MTLKCVSESERKMVDKAINVVKSGINYFSLVKEFSTSAIVKILSCWLTKIEKY